jgi:hypothetical protein
MFLCYFSCRCVVQHFLFSCQINTNSNGLLYIT